MKALEVRINSVMAERRKSQMQTLGAKNAFGNNNVPKNHRNSTASIPASEVFSQVNQAFEEDIYGVQNAVPMPKRSGNVTWKSSTGGK